MQKTILVVDDDPQVRDVVAQALHDEGYRVREAADGLKALQEIAASPPDLVLSDVRMPRLDGVKLAERLARRPSPPPVILMSADRTGLARGARSFLAKPFPLDELLGTVARVLAQNGRGTGPNVNGVAGRPTQHQRFP